jgi:tetratricopeptide (TPR) repeat protein
MYADRFRDYVFANNAKRLRDDRISLCIAFAVYCWLALLLGMPERTAAVDSVFVLAGCMVYFAVRYCATVPQSVSLRPRIGFLYRPVTRRLAFVSILLVLCLAPLPHVGAAVIDHRLRSVTRTVPISPEAAVRIQKDLQLAKRLRAPLSRQVLTHVRDTLQQSALHAQESAALAKPAEALINYEHEDPRYIDRLGEVPPRAMTDLQRGVTYVHDAVRYPQSWKADLNASVQAMTRAIEESGGNRTFQALALMSRTVPNLALGNGEAALADVRAAEALGSLDLATIALVKGTVLAHQENPEEARQAVGLLTLALQLNADPTPQYLGYAARCSAYLRLGEYQNALSDAKKVIELAGPFDGTGYRFTIVSYLGLGDYEAALQAADEYRSIPSRVADKWFEVVEEYPANPQLAFDRLYSAATSLSNSMPQ